MPLDDIRQKKELIDALSSQLGVCCLRVFGSVARRLSLMDGLDTCSLRRGK